MHIAGFLLTLVIWGTLVDSWKNLNLGELRGIKHPSEYWRSMVIFLTLVGISWLCLAYK
jgi:hypothetical protein